MGKQDGLEPKGPVSPPPQAPKTDRELVSLAQGGDIRAFEELLRRHEKLIYNLARRILQNREEAADILQEASFKAYSALPGFAGHSSFSTWFYRIAANLCLMKLRQKKAAVYSLDKPAGKSEDGEDGARPIEIPDWSGNPAAELANRELREALEKYIGALPDTYRLPFIMFELDGRPVREIARLLEISEPAVKTRLHRARSMLQEKLSAWFEHLNGKTVRKPEKAARVAEKERIPVRVRGTPLKNARKT